MPNPGAMMSLQAFERESINTVIHIPDYRLRQHLSIGHQEPVVVEAFVAFDEMFYLHLKWWEGSHYPEVLLSSSGTQQRQLVLDLNVQSSHFTHSTGDSAYSVAAPQWIPCTWSTPVAPVELRKPEGCTIQLTVDRPPTYHNDINISLEQTVTFTVMGMIWQMDGAPIASLQCASYLVNRQAADVLSTDVTALMVENIAAAREAPDISTDVQFQLEDDASTTVGVHAFLLQAQSPVFRRMLAGPMREATDRTVKMAGVLPRELEDFLRALYGLHVPAEAEEDDDRLISLLSLADRYEVIALRDECAALLQARLTEANMAAILRAADMHQASGLRLAALDFIVADSDRIAVAMDSDDPSVRRSIREHMSVARKAPQVAAVDLKQIETTLTV